MLPQHQYNNKGINKTLRKVLNSHNLTLLDISKVFGCSNVMIHHYMNNPYRMTLLQLVVLSGLLNMPLYELVALIFYNTPKLDKEQTDTLSSIITKHKPTE